MAEKMWAENSKMAPSQITPQQIKRVLKHSWRSPVSELSSAITAQSKEHACIDANSSLSCYPVATVLKTMVHL